MALTPDGKRAVSASDDQTLKVWDLGIGSAIQPLEGHSPSVYGVAVTPDGKWALSASWDGTLKVWDLRTAAYLEFSNVRCKLRKHVTVAPTHRKVPCVQRCACQQVLT